MKKPIILLFIVAFSQLTWGLEAVEKVESKDASLLSGFAEPSSQYGLRTWWHWVNERVSKDGITKDLEAMKSMGYKGVHMVNFPQGGETWTVGDDVVGSDVWYEKVEFAAKECDRLGMEFSFGSCPGCWGRFGC